MTGESKWFQARFWMAAFAGVYVSPVQASDLAATYTFRWKIRRRHVWESAICKSLCVLAPPRTRVKTKSEWQQELVGMMDMTGKAVPDPD